MVEDIYQVVDCGKSVSFLKNTRLDISKIYEGVNIEDTRCGTQNEETRRRKKENEKKSKVVLPGFRRLHHPLGPLLRDSPRDSPALLVLARSL